MYKDVYLKISTLIIKLVLKTYSNLNKIGALKSNFNACVKEHGIF